MYYMFPGFFAFSPPTSHDVIGEKYFGIPKSNTLSYRHERSFDLLVLTSLYSILFLNARIQNKVS